MDIFKFMSIIFFAIFALGTGIRGIVTILGLVQSPTLEDVVKFFSLFFLGITFSKLYDLTKSAN